MTRRRMLGNVVAVAVGALIGGRLSQNAELNRDRLASADEAPCQVAASSPAKLTSPRRALLTVRAKPQVDQIADGLANESFEGLGV